jgi:katanin p60 ATPase-containing subunit A1
LDALAKATEGYSGADVTNVCRDAAMMSMRRLIAGKTPADIRRLKLEEVEQPITQSDFHEAIRR